MEPRERTDSQYTSPFLDASMIPDSRPSLLLRSVLSIKLWETCAVNFQKCLLQKILQVCIALLVARLSNIQKRRDWQV